MPIIGSAQKFSSSPKVTSLTRTYRRGWGGGLLNSRKKRPGHERAALFSSFPSCTCTSPFICYFPGSFELSSRLPASVSNLALSSHPKAVVSIPGCPLFPDCSEGVPVSVKSGYLPPSSISLKPNSPFQGCPHVLWKVWRFTVSYIWDRCIFSSPFLTQSYIWFILKSLGTSLYNFICICVSNFVL